MFNFYCVIEPAAAERSLTRFPLLLIVSWLLFVIPLPPLRAGESRRRITDRFTEQSCRRKNSRNVRQRIDWICIAVDHFAKHPGIVLALVVNSTNDSDNISLEWSLIMWNRNKLLIATFTMFLLNPCVSKGQDWEIKDLVYKVGETAKTPDENHKIYYDSPEKLTVGSTIWVKNDTSNDDMKFKTVWKLTNGSVAVSAEWVLNNPPEYAPLDSGEDDEESDVAQKTSASGDWVASVTVSYWLVDDWQELDTESAIFTDDNPPPTIPPVVE